MDLRTNQLGCAVDPVPSVINEHQGIELIFLRVLGIKEWEAIPLIYFLDSPKSSGGPYKARDTQEKKSASVLSTGCCQSIIDRYSPILVLGAATGNRGMKPHAIPAAETSRRTLRNMAPQTVRKQENQPIPHSVMAIHTKIYPICDYNHHKKSSQWKNHCVLA